MDFKQLEAFVHVIDNKSFSKTAEQLFLTQPTISAHIASLERELGTKLVVRTTKEVYPTKVGQTLYQYAQDMLSMRRNAIQAVKNFENSMEGSIVIGASTIPAQYFLPQILADFRKEYPTISFHIQSFDSAQVIQKLQDRKIEIGMTGTFIECSKCIYEPMATDRMVVITPNNKRYQAMLGKGFPVQRLVMEPFICRERGSGTRRETEYFLREMGVDPAELKIVAEMENTESIKKSVSQGLGISIVSNSAAEDYRQFGKLLTFDFDNMSLTRKLYLVRHKNCPLSPVARAFYQYALTYYQKK